MNRQRWPLGGPWSDASLWRRTLRFWGPNATVDVDDEIAFHLDMRIRDLMAGGMSLAAARDRAERDFGNVRVLRRECITIDERRVRRGRRQEVLGSMLLDIKFGLRALRKSPAFTAMAAICIALGVGVTTTIFTAVQGILIRPLPYPHADELAVVYARWAAKNAHRINICWPDYVDWKEQNRSFSAIGMYTWSTATLSGNGDAERVEGAAITSNLFPLLGVKPQLGRYFTPDEEVDGRDRVVILSDGLWRRRYAADRTIVGHTITVDGLPYTVVGVMPPRFNFPDRGQVWTPFVPDETAKGRSNRYLAAAIGRLKPGISMEAARSDFAAISKRLEQQYPQDNSGWDAELISMREDLVGDLRQPLLVFLGAVAMVLLIACANVANLMLARGAARQREVAVRVALGAGRRRVVRQVLVESLLLALIGGTIGAALSRLGVKLIALAFPNDVPFYISLDMNAMVALFVVTLTTATGVLFGIVPAIRATRVDLNLSLKEGGRGSGDGREKSRLRGALVVGEVALSLVLVIGATLLIKSYRSYTNTRLGFDEHGILSARVSLLASKYGEIDRRRAYWVQLYSRIAALPGVQAVGSANGIPFSGWDVQAYMTIEGTAPRNKDLDVHYQKISPDYFKAIGVPIVKGRGFTYADRDTAAHLGIINETFARKEFANQDPLGRRLKIGGPDSRDPWITIIGVARDFRHYRLPQPMGPAIYFPQLENPSYGHTLAIRTTLGDPTTLVPAVREVLRSLDPDVPAYDVRTFEQQVSRALWRPRLQGTTLGVFAALAMLLAIVGVYGVVAYSVAQRIRELGVRVALGASKGQVATLVVAQGTKLTLYGVALGVIAAWSLTRFLQTLLYGVEAHDLATFIGVPLILAAAAVLASWVPARRATRVDPVVAMRSE